jgi:signal transduction histidine kinase
LLAGLLVGAAIFLSPFANVLLLRLFPPPNVTFELRFCEEGETPSPKNRCLPEGPGSAWLRERADERGQIFHRRVAVSAPAMGATFGAATPLMVSGSVDGPRNGPMRHFEVEGVEAMRSHFMWINLVSFSLVVGAAVLLASLLLRGPFRALQSAIGDIERGSPPPAWAFSGPTELKTVGQALTRLGLQLRSNLQERELMLAGLSHDLRSPLARIQAALELRSDGGEDWRDTLRDVEEIDHIVGQCIDYARDGQDESPQALPLDSVVAAALQTRRRDGVELRLDAPAELPLRPQSLARAVRNLVDNACRHGAPPVRVSTRIVDDYAVLRVEDGGGGIAPQAWSTLRKPFARGSRARNPGGAGLGLAIVQRVTDMHDGRLVLVPRDAGTAFAVELYLPRR